jgi:hypothetical protein
VDTGSVSLALTLAAAYGLTLTYFYQLGFLYSIGFQYASLTSPLDILTNGGVILGYAALIFWAAILLMMGVQGASQLGVDAARWIVNHESLITAGTAAVMILAFLDLVLFRRHFHSFLAAMVLNIIGLLAVLYATFFADQKILIWTLLFAVFGPLLLSFGLGFQFAHFVKTIDKRRYEISLADEKISNVRILRLSSAGIMYIRHNTSLVVFVNMSKVEKIAQIA